MSIRLPSAAIPFVHRLCDEKGWRPRRWNSDEELAPLAGPRAG